MCQDDLGLVTTDEDSDSVPDVADDCPGTSPDMPADRLGCSAAQFCRAIDVGEPRGQAICRHLDWLNDEPLGIPHGCVVVQRSCEAAPS